MNMAFVYSGVQYDQKEILAGIAEELPGVPLIGNTSLRELSLRTIYFQ